MDDNLSKVQSLIVKVVFGTWILIFMYTHLIIPSYPEANEEHSFIAIKNFVEKNIEKEARIQGQVFFRDKASNEDRKEYIELLGEVNKELKECGQDKECYIDVYDDFMSDNVTDRTEKITRYMYMQQYGIIGKLINESFSWTY